MTTGGEHDPYAQQGWPESAGQRPGQSGPFSPGQPQQPYPGQPQPYPGQPQPYPGQYPGAGWQPVSRPTNGFAIASLVLGILWIYWVGSILALVFGYIGRRQIRERGESGAGLATAGIVLGWIGVGVLVFGFVAALISYLAV